MVYIPHDPTKNERAKRSKYRNTKCKAGGLKFDSVGERNRYFYLSEAEREGRIRNLQCQVKYALEVNGELICHYIADFVYVISHVCTKSGHVNFINRDGSPVVVVEDFKGGYRLPPDWPIKQKLMKALHGVDVKIVKEPTAKI